MDQQREGGSLPRREFLRRSSLGAVALAALGAGVHAPGTRSVLAQVVGDPAADMPEQPIAAVAVWGDDVIAVGGVRGDARAWRRSGPQQPWVQTAGPQSFPHGTALTGLAVHDGRAVASGCSGPEHGTHPELFTSSDVSSWVSEPGVGAAAGVCTGVAFVAGRGPGGRRSVRRARHRGAHRDDRLSIRSGRWMGTRNASRGQARTPRVGHPARERRRSARRRPHRRPGPRLVRRGNRRGAVALDRGSQRGGARRTGRRDDVPGFHLAGRHRRQRPCAVLAATGPVLARGRSPDGGRAYGDGA